MKRPKEKGPGGSFERWQTEQPHAIRKRAEHITMDRAGQSHPGAFGNRLSGKSTCGKVPFTLYT